MGKIKIDKADSIFSKYIRTRDDWSCKRCGKYYEPPTSALHNSHFQGRGKENTRYDPENCDALCYGCHRYFTSQPGEHYQWQVEQKGQKKVEELILRSNTYKKKDRKAEVQHWTTRLEALEKEKDKE